MKVSKETQIIKYPNKHAHHERFKTNEQHTVSYSLRSFSALVIIEETNAISRLSYFRRVTFSSAITHMHTHLKSNNLLFSPRNSIMPQSQAPPSV